MMKKVGVVALILTVIGAINWGFWGFFQFDLVAWLFGGSMTALSRVIYAIIGISGVVVLCGFSKKCRCCGSCCCSDKSCNDKSCNDKNHHHHN